MNRQQAAALWLAFIIAFLCGCGKKDTNQAVAIAPDNSLSVPSYLALGVPAPDRPWSGDDYVRSLRVLQDLATKDPTKLPRAGSGKSGELFARIVNLENVSILANTNFTLTQRFSRMDSCMTGLKDHMRLYITPMYKAGGPSFDRELVEFSPAVLVLTHAMLMLSGEFMSSLPPSERENPNRRAGLEKVKSGVAVMIDGALLIFGEKDRYRASERVRLAKSLINVLPQLLPTVGKYSQTEFHDRVKKLAAAERDVELKASLEKLSAAIRLANPSP